MHFCQPNLLLITRTFSSSQTKEFLGDPYFSHEILEPYY
jgi:hypothetical protein